MKSQISVTGVPDALRVVIAAIAHAEDKTLAQVGVEALELLARERNRWPPQPRQGATDGR